MQDLAVKDFVSMGMRVTHFRSIQRQFNSYGFRKIETTVETCSRYVNKDFTRDNEALQARICRRTSSKPKAKSKPREFHTSSTRSGSNAAHTIRTLHERCSVLESNVANARQATLQRLERFWERSTPLPFLTDEDDWPFDDMPLYDYGNGCVSPSASSS